MLCRWKIVRLKWYACLVWNAISCMIWKILLSTTRENKVYLLIFFISYIYTCKVENLNLASFVNTKAYACHSLCSHVKETPFSTNGSGQRGYMHILVVSRTSKDLPDTDQHDPDRILICSCNQFTSWMFSWTNVQFERCFMSQL